MQFALLALHSHIGIVAISKQKKEEILKDLQENLKKAKDVIFVNFHGLNVSATNELRKLLRNLKVKYLVAKKTLIKKAFDSINFAGDMPELEGEIALAFSSDDPIVLARELKQFAKNHKIKFLGGVFENKYIDSNTVIMLANIPPREVLLAQFVNIINSPIQGTVVTLNGIITKFVRILSEIKK